MLDTTPGHDPAPMQASTRYVPRHRAERSSLIHLPGTKVRRGVVTTVAGLALVGGVGTTVPAQAASRDAGDDKSSTSFSKDELPDLNPGGAVLRIAASKAGTPYSYGATGPGAFDCSGFTQWVFHRVGKNLPRTSSAQAGAVRRVSAGDARPGDLVFFTGGSGVYHVGIYAGGGMLWHAPRPGEGVRRERIWTSSVFYGRP